MTNYKTEEYRGHTIRWVYDQCPENPRDWDVAIEHMICWHSRYNLGDDHNYDDPGDLFRRLVLDYVPESSIAKYLKKSDSLTRFELVELDEDDEMKYAVELRYESWRGKNRETLCTGNNKRELMKDAVADYTSYAVENYLSINECETLLEPYLVIRPISIHDHSGVSIWYGKPNCRWDSGIVGYGYVTKEDVILKCDNANESNWREKAVEDMDAFMKTYDNYIAGEVFGYIIENEDGEEVDSCYGFYGDESIEWQMSEIKAIIDSVIAKREQEALAESCEFWSCMA